MKIVLLSMNYLLCCTLQLIAVIHLSSQNDRTVIAQSPQDSIPTSVEAEIILDKTKNLPPNTQVAIALIKNGVIHFEGIRRIKDTIESINNSNAFFEIGSITKVFTCTILADFVLDDKLKLNDYINNYLPFDLHQGTKITFRQLANHTSGLPRLPSNLDLQKADPTNPYKDYGEKELVDYLTRERELTSEPGEQYEYSNLGVGLLGYILSEMDNTIYEDLLQSLIFKKYGMKHSTTIRTDVKPMLVRGINDKGMEVPNWDMSVLMGAGGILSSVYELSQFATAQFDPDNKELALTRLPTFKVSEQMENGLGWALLTMEDGSEWCWHNGGTGGYTSSIILDTENRNGVIILSNLSAFSKKTGNIGELSHELMLTLSR